MFRALFNLLLYMYRYGYETQVIKRHPQEELVTFIITFLRNMKYIKNPYLKAKFVEVRSRRCPSRGGVLHI